MNEQRFAKILQTHILNQSDNQVEERRKRTWPLRVWRWTFNVLLGCFISAVCAAGVVILWHIVGFDEIWGLGVLTDGARVIAAGAGFILVSIVVIDGAVSLYRRTREGQPTENAANETVE